MKTKLAAVLTVSALLVPVIAGATQVSWLVQGQISTVSGPFSINVGDPFSMVLNFDTSTPVSNAPCNTNSGGPGTVCRHNGGLTQSFTDIVINGVSYGNFGADPAGSNSIIVRNNTLFDPCNGNPAPCPVTVDGYSFSTSQYYQNPSLDWFVDSLALIFRGPENLGIVTDGRILPALPPAGLLDLGTHLFQFCASQPLDSNLTPIGDCSGLVQGTITSVASVPEPESLALLGLGLGCLGLVPRRRRT